MEIRPHHYLCIQMFTGHGYDEKFTRHMSEVKKNLSDDTEIIIHEGCDEICRECPHREYDKCHDYDKVRRFDDEVMKRCGLTYGDKMMWNDIVSVVSDKIFKTDHFDNICCDCKWYRMCRDTKEKKWAT